MRELAPSNAVTASLPTTCGPLHHLATLDDGSLLCHHEGFRFWLTHVGIQVSARGPRVRDAAPVDGGWVFSCVDDVARFATTPVGSWRALGPMPDDGTVLVRLESSGQKGALLTTARGRVYEADATGVRVLDVPFPVRQALAFGGHRLIVSDHGTVAHGTWATLRAVPTVDFVVRVALDARGPLVHHVDLQRRRLDGTIVPSSFADDHDDPRIQRLVEAAHAALPFESSVPRFHDGALAAVVGQWLVVRRSDDVRSFWLPTRHLHVVRGDLGGWRLGGFDGDGIARITDDGAIVSRWGRSSASGTEVWWGSCDAPQDTAPTLFPALACVLDAHGRSREVQLHGLPYAQCGNRIYAITSRTTVIHDVATGARSTIDDDTQDGTCLGDELVVVRRRGDTATFGALGGDHRTLPWPRPELAGVSGAGEVVVFSGEDTHHSVDEGRTWRRVADGSRIDCSAVGCFTDHDERGYVAIRDLPTEPPEDSSRVAPRPLASTDWTHDDLWGFQRAPFELDCARHPRDERPPVRWAAGRLEVASEESRWTAPLERTALPYRTLAVGERVVVLRAGCGRVLRVAPDGVVVLDRPDVESRVSHLGECGQPRPLAARVEADGHVAVSWIDECSAIAARFAADGRLRHARRFAVGGDNWIDLAMRDGKAHVALLWADRGELAPLDPRELPRWLRLPPLTRWTPHVCADGSRGTEFHALWLSRAVGGMELRLDDQGGVCVLGSMGANGYRARDGQLVRRVREGSSWFEERCSLRPWASD